MRLEVDTGGYDSAAEALEGGNVVLAGGYRSLTAKLGGYSAMAGDDASSEGFVRNYDDAAADTVAAFAELTTAYGNLSVLTSTSGANHREANRASVYKRGSRPDGGGKQPQPELAGGVRLALPDHAHAREEVVAVQPHLRCEVDDPGRQGRRRPPRNRMGHRCPRQPCVAGILPTPLY